MRLCGRQKGRVYRVLYTVPKKCNTESDGNAIMTALKYSFTGKPTLFPEKLTAPYPKNANFKP